MTPPAKFPGHYVNFGKGLKNLFLNGCWHIPDIMASSAMALVGIGMAAVGCYHYAKMHGENSEFKGVYYILRDGDVRACKLKNPVYTAYEC